MAKKPAAPKALTFVQIVMGADAEVIKAAYEARIKIDDLLRQREEAYRQIQTLEEQVDGIMGDAGVYVFPAPPCPVAGTPAGGRTKKAKPTGKPPARATKPEPDVDKAATPVEDTPAPEPEPTDADAANDTPSAESATDSDAPATPDAETDDK